MANIGNLFTSGAKVLKLEKEFEALKAIDAVARRWMELEPSLEDFDEMIDFLEVLDDEIGKKDVKDTFKALGLDDELAALTKQRKRISSAFQEIGIAHPQRLLQSIPSNLEDTHSANTGATSWSLIDTGSANTSLQVDKSIDYDFDLGTRASIEVEGGALWPYALDSDRARMVRLGVEGELSAKGAAVLPFRLGSAGVSFAADGKTRLDYYFEPADQSVTLAGAVADRLLHAPNPFSIDSVRAAMKTSGDFFGYDMELGGGISANVELQLGKAFELSNIGGVKVALSFNATVVRRRDFQISLRRIGPVGERQPDMQLVVSGQTKKLDQKQLGIKVSLEFGKLVDHVHEQLKPVVAEWDSALQTVTPFLTPGTYLQTQATNTLSAAITNLLGNSSIAAAIDADMRLLLGTSEAKTSNISDFLTGEVTGALNGLVSSVIGDVQAEAEALHARLKARLPLFETLDEDKAILKELSTLLSQLQTDFDTAAGKIIKKQADRTKIANTLSRAGANVNRVKASANGALQGIRNMLREYDATIKKAMEELTKAANRKVSLSLTYATMRSSDTTYEIDARLPFHTAQEDYTALLSGNFIDISKLVLQSPPVIAFGEDSNIKRIVTHQSQFGGEFVGFGIAADFSTVFTGKASIAVDHRGIVSILSEGQAKDVSINVFGDKEKTEATFFDTLSLTRAKTAEEHPGTPDVLDIGVNLRRTDPKGLKPDEFKSLMHDMKRYGLITTQGAEEVAATVDQWMRAGSSRSVPAIIDVALPLTGAQIMQVLRADPKQTIMDAVHAQIDTVRRTPGAKMRDYETGIAAARSILRLDQADDVTVLYQLAMKGWRDSRASSEANVLANSDAIQPFKDLNARARAAGHLVELGYEMRRLHVTLDAAALDPSKWDFKAYAAAQKSIADKSKEWLATGQFLIGFGIDGVDRQMAAFFVLIGKMAGLTDDQVREAVSLSIQNTSIADQVILVR